MSGAESNFAAWLAKAANDVLNIDNNLRATTVPWDTVCFHAQQAAEKTLKAFQVFNGRPPVWTHDLVALLATCVQIEPSLADLEADCRALTSYGIASRYPADLFEPGGEDGRAMVEAMQRIRSRVLPLLPTPN